MEYVRCQSTTVEIEKPQMTPLSPPTAKHSRASAAGGTMCQRFSHRSSGYWAKSRIWFRLVSSQRPSKIQP
jgi:hypothetical protein